MILSLCIITKGDSELENVKVAVGSIIDFVDHIYITTNAKKYKVTKRWCESIGKIEHSHLDWADDFSAQRNFNFSQVSSDTDYIVWMDSDDVIVHPELLSEIAGISKQSGFDTVFFDYWYGAKFNGKPSIKTFVKNEVTHYRERLIRPGSIVWKKRIHESPVPVDPQVFKYSKRVYSKEWPIVWLHLGADRRMSAESLLARMDRNRRLLEMELAEERESGEADPRTILYLMKIYAESDDERILRKCIELGKEYLLKSGWDEERATCDLLISKCFGLLKDHDNAKKWSFKAIEEFPKSSLAYLYLARAYFNLKDFRAMKHWMGVGISLKVGEGSGIKNILEAKALSAELMLQYYNFGERNVEKAWDSARLLNSINPTEQNQFNEDFLFNQKELDAACANTHNLFNYMRDIQREGEIPKLIEVLPREIGVLPFAVRYYNTYKNPKNWEKNEICYFANFGGEHFEKWDGNSLKGGIGGSETAVIRLSEEWTKLGYKVTVYGDPKEEVEINGVLYAPWYKFNPRDRFNIFIQWRSSNMVNRVNAKKVLIDLHDVFDGSSHKQKLNQIDKLMVKSLFHRGYAEDIPNEKVEIISNGI